MASEKTKAEKILKAAKEFPLDILGTSDERIEILDLKKDFEFWNLQIQDLLRGCDWSYPMILIKLETSEMRLAMWQSRMAGQISFNADSFDRKIGKLYCHKNEEKQPSSQEVERVKEVLKSLAKLWPPLTVKYVKVIADSIRDAPEKYEACKGLVHINFDEVKK